MKQIEHFVRKLRGVNFVVRWDFHPTIRKENVAEHSFWVATFAALLAPPEERAKVALSALWHDAEEAITGDLPALVKGRVPKGAWEEVVAQAEAELFRVEACETAEEREILTSVAKAVKDAHSPLIKCADLLAALQYCAEERKMGNTYFSRIERELVAGLEASSRKLDPGSAERLVALLAALGYNWGMGLERPVEISHL